MSTPEIINAVEQGDLNEVEARIQAGDDVNMVDRLGWTALHEAAMSNSDTAICALLLQHGASVNKVNTYGETPLHMAAGNESAPLPICELLLSHGANPEAVDNDNLMPIDLAEERGGLRPEPEQNALRTVLQVSPQRARWRAEQISRQQRGFIRRVGFSALVFAMIAVCLAMLPRMQVQAQSEPTQPTIKRSLRMHVAKVFFSP